MKVVVSGFRLSLHRLKSIFMARICFQSVGEPHMPRPYWSGQIQISLVSFGVKLFPATEAKSEIHFHQLSRKSGKRIKHQKVSGDEEPVESSDIVKGYEYRKGEYVMVEPEEIEQVRIPSKHTIEVTQFVDAEELVPEF